MTHSTRISLLALLTLANTAAAQTAYDLIDLGTLAMQSNAAAVNIHNQVVGTSVAADFYFSATSFDLGGPTSFPPYIGFRNTVATTITDGGTIYGVGFNLGSLTPVALRFDHTGTVALGTFVPLAARSDGMLVGKAPVSSTGLFYEAACVYSGGALTLLPSLGGPTSQAFDVDSAGRIVGSSSLVSGPDPKPTLWVNGVPANLGTLGGSRGQAKAINETGVIVGFSENAAGLALPTRWTINATGTVLSRVALASLATGHTAFANDVNATGMVVGTAGYHAVRWSPSGAIADLNSFRSPLSGWVVETATAVNNNGVIVGTGSLLGFPRAFMMVPVSCIADFNRDGSVDFFDYLDFVDTFSRNNPLADFNLDGVIDFFDYLDFVDAFASGC